MFWKAILITTLAIEEIYCAQRGFVYGLLLMFLSDAKVGVLAEYEFNEEQKNQVKTALRNYCKKNGAEDKVEEVQTSITNFVDCVKGLFDVDTLKAEIEEAKPNGALDEVFKKYCAKSPQLKTCIHNVFTGISPCLESNVREHIGFADNATDQLIDFVCYKDGDRIALFIAENGPQCFQAKANDIRECANSVKAGIDSVDEAKKLTLDEQCSKFDEMTACIVTALETCDTPTPGNMADSLFKYVRRSSPCPKKE